MTTEEMLKELETLPKGYISKKVIKGITYFYLQSVVNNKITSKYISKKDIDNVTKQLERRKELEQLLKDSYKDRAIRRLGKRDLSFTGSLMMGDIVTAKFMNSEAIYINDELCPLYIKRTKDIRSYFANRILDLSRPNARLLLKTLKIQNKDEYVSLYSYGACISDNYWFKPSGSRKTYNDIKFDNDIYSDLALKGIIYQFPSLNSPSPELTNTGSFEKCWKYINNEWWMFKKGDEDQIYSELFCSKLSKEIGIPAAEYQYDNGYIKSKNFTSLYNFEPMYSLAGDNEEYDYVFNILYSLNKKFAKDYIQLLWFDAIVYNVDRHNNNYGLLRDKIDGHIVSFAPNFDNNMSLLSYNKTLDQNPKNDALISLFTSFIKNNKQAKELFMNLKPRIISKDILNNIFNDIEIKKDNNKISNFIMNRYEYLESFKKKLT